MATSFVNATAVDVGTAGETLYTASGTKAIVIGCNVANKTGGIVPVDLILRSGDSDTYVVKGYRVGNGENVELMRGNKLVLKNGDSLVAVSALDEAFDVIASILTGVA
jgi:hypothetical protein